MGIDSHGNNGHSHSHTGCFPFLPIPIHNFVTNSHSHGNPMGFPFPLGIPFPWSSLLQWVNWMCLCHQTTISLYHEDQDDDSRRLHSWHFDAASIKSISHYRRNSKGVFLYVYENSDDFHIFFPSEQHKQRSVAFQTGKLSASYFVCASCILLLLLLLLLRTFI